MRKRIFAHRWLWIGLVLVSALGLVAARSLRSGELSPGEARSLIAKMPGFDLSRDAVRVKEVNAVGNSAVVVAQVETAFRMERDAGGNWRVAEIRTGQNRWQNVDELARSLAEEKGIVAKSEMETMATALESYRRVRGVYVTGDTVAVLMDHLQPRFICRVIRIDPWHHPYAYDGNGSGYTLRSAGPDGELNTPDDVVNR
jgi:hypothetical protein